MSDASNNTTPAPSQDQESHLPTKRCPMTGSTSEEFTTNLLHQTGESLWLSGASERELDTKIDWALAALQGIGPRDELEGMLAAQMVAAHNASMECYRRAMIPEQHANARNQNLVHAHKLSRTYAAMMEALARHRGKGQQKVTVEYVHVHAGGQAIVGSVNTATGRRGDDS